VYNKNIELESVAVRCRNW